MKINRKIVASGQYLIREEPTMNETRFGTLFFQRMAGLEVVHGAERLHRETKPIDIVGITLK